MKKILGVTAAAVLLIAGLIAPAAATQAQTCKDVDGFSDNLSEDSDGVWGSVDWLGSPGSDAHIELTVAEGYEVQLCLKKGSDGPVTSQWFGEGTHDLESAEYYPELGDDGFSHYGVRYRPVTPDPDPTQVWVCRDGEVVGPIDEGTSLEDETEYASAEAAAEDPACQDDDPEDPTLTVSFTKAWDGDEFDDTDVVVTFDVDIDGTVDTYADGEVIEYEDDYELVGENVTGFPDTCEWEQTDIQASSSIDEEGNEEASYTVVNTVDCADVAGVIIEDDDDEDEDEDTPVKVVTEVLDEAIEAETLPETGASALLLALLGLSAIGSGGVLLRRRR